MSHPANIPGAPVHFALPDELDTASFFTTVLLVEDERPHAALIKRAIQPMVGEIVHVSSGQEALNAIETQLFELVLCDLHLGDMSGIEVLRAIRELRPALPMIVLTSSHVLDDAVSAMREGAWDYMLKQFSEDFNQRMKFVISRTCERKQQQIRETQLRSERRNFWAAVRAAQDGLAIIGSQGSVVFANEAFHMFCKLLGMSDRTASGPYNLIELLSSQDQSVAAALKKQLQEGRADLLWNSELEVKEKFPDESKHSCYFDLSLSSVKLEELEELGIVDTGIQLHRYIIWVRDVTRRKEQERFQRDLLSTTSHDLKGPLGAILTSAELLSDEEFLRSAKGQELVTRIASCARNSITIIDELLSARRIQDGVLVVKPRWYPLNESLEDIVLDYVPLAKAKAIDFSSRPAAPEVKIFADRIGLARVLGNLISNAVKYTPRGGKVELYAEQVPGAVRVAVSDTGPGIDSKDRHLLFERYTRLEEHEQIEGTGLGLYVTKNIIDAHNGRIEVLSEVGVGTTFVVTFPDEPQSTQ